MACTNWHAVPSTSMQKRHERSERYGLEDDDLTHYGQSIGDMENFDEIELSKREEEEGRC